MRERGRDIEYLACYVFVQALLGFEASVRPSVRRSERNTDSSVAAAGRPTSLATSNRVETHSRLLRSLHQHQRGHRRQRVYAELLVAERILWGRVSSATCCYFAAAEALRMNVPSVLACTTFLVGWRLDYVAAKFQFIMLKKKYFSPAVFHKVSRLKKNENLN